MNDQNDRVESIAGQDGVFLFADGAGEISIVETAYIADPTATISSMALLLDHLGRRDDAARIDAAVDADIAARGSEKRSMISSRVLPFPLVEQYKRIAG